MTTRAKIEPREALVSAVRRRAAELECVGGGPAATGGHRDTDVIARSPRRPWEALYAREQFKNLALGSRNPDYRYEV